MERIVWTKKSTVTGKQLPSPEGKYVSQSNQDIHHEQPYLINPRIPKHEYIKDLVKRLCRLQLAVIGSKVIVISYEHNLTAKNAKLLPIVFRHIPMSVPAVITILIAGPDSREC